MSLLALGSPGGNETLYQLFNSMLRAIGLAYTTGTVGELIEVLSTNRTPCVSRAMRETRKESAPKTPISALIAPVAQPTSYCFIQRNLARSPILLVLCH